MNIADHIKEIVNKSPGFVDFMAQWLSCSKDIIVIIMESNFVIKSHNAGLSNILQCNKELSGATVQSILLPESHCLFDADIVSRKMPICLNFKFAANSPISLSCYVAENEGQYVLIGDHPILSESETLKMMTLLNNELSSLTRELNRKNIALQKAQSEIKALRGIIPICMYCKEIRNDEGSWTKLEQYITEHSEAEFSHGICPECMEKRYPGHLAKKREDSSIETS